MLAAWVYQNAVIGSNACDHPILQLFLQTRGRVSEPVALTFDNLATMRIDGHLGKQNDREIEQTSL